MNMDFSGLTVIDKKSRRGRACCLSAPWLSRTAGDSRPYLRLAKPRCDALMGLSKERGHSCPRKIFLCGP